MLTKSEIKDIIQKVKDMKVAIPAKSGDYHDAILALHENLNDLTELKITIAQEVMEHGDQKEYMRYLRLLTKEVIDPMIKQLTLGKQMFNMIIHKGKQFQEDTLPPRKSPEEELSSDVPGQEDVQALEQAETSDYASVDQIVSMVNELDAPVPATPELENEIEIDQGKEVDIEAELNAFLT